MKIFFTDQRSNLKAHLARLKDSKVMRFDKSRLLEKTSVIDLETEKNLDQLDLDFFFNYKIFAENILVFKSQWEDESRKMKEGDTIVQQVYIPPTKKLSQKIIFGVRINKITDLPDIKGFSYETLEGHVEKGESAFFIQQQNGKLIFKIQTYSAPGNLLTKLLGRIFTIPYQTFCTRKALENVKNQIANL